MPDWQAAYREDWTGDGFFAFQSTGVQYAATGIVGLRHSIYFDQGPWFLQNALGTALVGQRFDATTSRVSDCLTPITVDGGTTTGSYSLYRRMRLPRDFGAWAIVSFFTQKSGTVADFTGATLSLYKNGVVDPSLDHFSILPVASGDWEQMNELPSAVYAPGDFITFGIQVTVQAVHDPSPAILQLADFGATYVTNKGNV